MHRCNLRGFWPRKKRWDYWAVTTRRHLLFLVVADVDYLGIAAASLLDLETGRRFEAAAVTPFGWGVHLAEPAGAGRGGATRFDHLGVRIAMESAPGSVALSASARSLGGDRLEVDLVVDRPPERDTLDVVVPFPDERFQLTSKQVGLAARGSVTLNGAPIDLDGAWACLDYGRGVWPRRSARRWAAAAGTTGGRKVALNLGGLRTDGSGVTENGMWLDGRLHKLGERLDFTRAEGNAWRISSPEVDLRFTPRQRRRVALELGIVAARLDWGMGSFSGTVVGPGGAPISIDGLPGWTEELRARW